MIDPTDNATPAKSTKSRHSNFSVQTQIQAKSEFEFVLRDTKECELLDLVDCGGVACLVDTVVWRNRCRDSKTDRSIHTS